MMRWFAGLLVATLVLGLAQAQTGDDPQSLARFVPADYAIYMAVRVDDAYLQTFNDKLNGILGRAPADLALPPSIDLRTLIDMPLSDAGTSYAAIRTWLGDTIAIGLDARVFETSPVAPEEQRGVVVLQLADSAGFRAFLESTLPNLSPGEPVGDYFVYRGNVDTVIYVGENEALLATAGYNPLTREARLVDDPEFRETVDKLPADSYNGLIFIRPGVIAAASGAPAPDALAMMQSTAVAVGFTLLDGEVFAVDVALNIGEPTPRQPIDPTFARFIPPGTDLLVHGRDLSQELIGFLNLVAAESGNTSGPSPEEQLRMSLQMLAGLDLDEDVLSWMTGDYALYLGADMRLLIASATSGAMQPSEEALSTVSIGLLISATDPAKARNLADRIGALMVTAAQQQPDLNAEQVTLNGVPAMRITTAAMGIGGPALNLYILATEQAFYIGTEQGAQRVTSAGEGLTADPDFVANARYLLPDSLVSLYASGEGLVSFVGVGILAILGPAIGDVFENIVDELQSSFSPAPRRMTVQATGQPDIAEMLDFMLSIFGGATVSLAQDDTIAILRATLILR